MGQTETILAGCRMFMTGRERVLQLASRWCRKSSSVSAQTRVGGDQRVRFPGETERMAGPLMMSVNTWRTVSRLLFVLKNTR